MINGVHTILYSDDADATRTFLSEVLGWSSIDSGGGWLIFETPPTEMGIHPTKSAEGEVWATTPHHDISFLCDDIEATIAELTAKGVTFTDEVRDMGYGLVTTFLVPPPAPCSSTSPGTNRPSPAEGALGQRVQVGPGRVARIRASFSGLRRA